MIHSADSASKRNECQKSRPKKPRESVTFSSNSPETLSETMPSTNEQDNLSANLSANLSPTNPDERQFDLVIFAASGCVGKFLVEEMALIVDKLPNGHQSSPTLASTSSHQQQFAQHALRRRSVPSSSLSDNTVRWAIAGRSAIRLSETLCRAELSTGVRHLSSSVSVILADLNHRRSIMDMCQKAKLVINCAGPYTELGAEILIQACIECRTNYIDLAHEMNFVEMMREKYSDKAREAKVFILNGCGFQSMSAEMGLNFTKQVADGTIEQVKIILSMSDTCALVKSPSKRLRVSGIISEGMWNSLLADKAQELPVEERLRAKIAAQEQEAYLLDQEQLVDEDQYKTKEMERRTLLEASQGEDKDHGPTAPQPSTSATSDTVNIVGRISNHTKSMTARILGRKDTQSLVREIVQFRNRNVTLAWPLRLIQGFQGQGGRGYCWPIDNMSGDECQLIRSEMNNYELRRPDLDSDEGWRPIRCSTYLSVRNFTQLSLLVVWLFIFQILVKFSLFRYIMRKFPQLATLGHVASLSASHSAGSQQKAIGGQQSIERDSLSHIKFCQTFIAYGIPSADSCDPLESRDKHSARKQVQLLVSRVVGPEPNHVATATFAIQAAMTLLSERDHLPCSGGVLTPGAAFSGTNIIFQLRKRNIKFEVLKKA